MREHLKPLVVSCKVMNLTNVWALSKDLRAVLSTFPLSFDSDVNTFSTCMAQWTLLPTNWIAQFYGAPFRWRSELSSSGLGFCGDMGLVRKVACAAYVYRPTTGHKLEAGHSDASQICVFLFLAIELICSKSQL
jgi:hypothetical protein